MTTPAGWYPDNQDPTRMRLWDGAQWSAETIERGADGPAFIPLPPPPPPVASPPATAVPAPTLLPASLPTQQRGQTNARTLKVFGGILGTFVLIAILGSAYANDKTATGKRTGSITAPDVTEEPVAEPAPVIPPSTDFQIDVKILQKQCFGSAGCNVVFRIDPSYIGSGEAKNLEVTYEVLGGEDGPQVNTFTIDEDGTASVDKEETLSTGVNPHITARVTDVAAG